MLHKLSIKGLIVGVFALILAMALGATASLLVTDRMTREALTRHEQAMHDAGGTHHPPPAVAATYRELKDILDLSSRVTLVMRIATFLVGLALAVLVYRRVAEMVAETEDFARRIERGDFSARFATAAGGETAALAAALNRMVDRLRATIEAEAATSQRLAYLVAATSAVIYAAKTGGDYGATYISPNVRSQLGHAPGDFTGNSAFWSDNIHPDDRDRVLALMDGLPAAGSIEAEYRFRHKDGSWRWMHDETSLARDATGEPLELVGSWIDITRRRELEVSLNRRDAILNAVTYGSARFLRAGEMDSAAEWNLAVETVLSHLGEATGVSRIWVVENTTTPAGDTIARPLHRWARPEFAVADADPLLAEYLSYRGEGLGVEALRLRRGELVRVQARDMPAPMRGRLERLGIHAQLLAPITVGNDWWGFMAFDDCADDLAWLEIEQEALRAAANLFGAASFARAGHEALRASLDNLGSVLAKLKQQSAEIERQNAELVRANRLKSEFLAAVTHELKTPLNGILGFADLLDAGLAGELAPQQREYVGDILGAGRQLHKLVARLLDLAQIDAGKKPCTPAEASIGALLAAAATTHEAAARARGITLRVEAAETLACVDAHLLHILLNELIDNAIKFNRDGGTVTLRAGVSLPSPRAGEGPGERGNVIIEVADSGIGIAAADLPHLFEPFVQADATIERRYGGTGIGLALARRIAELHGGDISVASTPGEGSCFTLRLPRAAAG